MPIATATARERAGVKRRCFGLDSSPTLSSETDSRLGQDQFHTAAASINREHKRRPDGDLCSKTCSPRLAPCRKWLDSISAQSRQNLCTSFQDGYNKHVPLLSQEQVEDITSPQLELQDATAVLLHVAVLATGLLFVDVADLEFETLRWPDRPRSVLHCVLKEALEEGVLCGHDMDQLPVLLLLSELERFAGFPGSADLYLREALRCSEHQSSNLDMFITDEEVIRRRGYVRACAFVRLQWRLFDPGCNPPQDHELSSQTRRPTHQLDGKTPEKSAFFAHQDLLTEASLTVRSPCLAGHSQPRYCHQQLHQWHERLPSFLNGDRHHDNWTPPLYFLHLQYLAVQLVSCTDERQQGDRIAEPNETCQASEELCGECCSYAARLVDTLIEYDQKFGVLKAPIICARHVILAARILLRNRTVMSPGIGTSADKSRLQAVRLSLETLAKSRHPTSSAAQDIGLCIGRIDSLQGSIEPASTLAEDQELDYSNAVENWHDLLPNDVGDVGIVDLFPAATLCSLEGALSMTDARIDNRWEGTMRQRSQTPRGSTGTLAQAAISPPSPPMRNHSEERLAFISDPVFCAYVDEMTYIVGQYNSPPTENEPEVHHEEQQLRMHNPFSSLAAKQSRMHFGLGSSTSSCDYAQEHDLSTPQSLAQDFLPPQSTGLVLANT